MNPRVIALLEEIYKLIQLYRRGKKLGADNRELKKYRDLIHAYFQDLYHERFCPPGCKHASRGDYKGALGDIHPSLDEKYPGVIVLLTGALYVELHGIESGTSDDYELRNAVSGFVGQGLEDGHRIVSDYGNSYDSDEREVARKMIDLLNVASKMR